MTDGDLPETVADLDPDRRVWVSGHYWAGNDSKVHLEKRCHVVGDDPTPKTAGVLFDDQEICTVCRGEKTGGVPAGTNPRTLRNQLIEM